MLARLILGAGGRKRMLEGFDGMCLRSLWAVRSGEHGEVAIIITKLTHSGDPAKGCGSDEIAVQVHDPGRCALPLPSVGPFGAAAPSHYRRSARCGVCS